ncbi:hypothetical protein ACOMHN_060035 [Nucella lapillus]
MAKAVYLAAMSVILTVTDTQSEEPPDTDTAPKLNGCQEQDEEDDEEKAREAELVVFEGTTQGLGLKICGGCSVDGTQDEGLFIKRVLPGGLVDLQGGLEEGDLILDVNRQSMDGVTYDRALSILRQASASNHVEMVITRDDEAREAFQELMSGIAYTAAQMAEQKEDSYPHKPVINGDQYMNTDTLEEFQSHMGDYYKTVGLRAVVRLPPPCHLDDLGSSGHHSSASSCHSEVARHLAMASPEPSDHHGELREGKARSLNSVLTHSFPMAVSSVNPSCRFPVAKLETTLQSLGFVISAQKHTDLLKHIPIDAQGLTSFNDFIQAVRQVYHSELQTRSNSQCSTPLLTSESPAPLSPSQVNGHFDGDSFLQQENEQLRNQVESLKEEVKEHRLLCQKAEEQLLTLRKESQAAMEESRSLRTKLRLAEQSQEAARNTEQDYEQVVAMLENDIAHLRLHMSKSDSVMEQRRLAVAACQLKKAETGKKTLEVTTNKLLAHVQHVQDVLSADISGSRASDSDKGEKKRKKQRAVQELLAEGQDVIRTTQMLLEQIPLPFGWEENYTADGVRYYINHLNQTTSWTHPLTNMEHQSVAMATGAAANQQPPPAVEMGKKLDKVAS